MNVAKIKKTRHKLRLICIFENQHEFCRNFLPTRTKTIFGFFSERYRLGNLQEGIKKAMVIIKYLYI